MTKILIFILIFEKNTRNQKVSVRLVEKIKNFNLKKFHTDLLKMSLTSRKSAATKNKNATNNLKSPPWSRVWWGFEIKARFLLFNIDHDQDQARHTFLNHTLTLFMADADF